jgi:hypothetical protein
VPTKEQVLAVLAGGTDYPAAAARLGIPPGLAYLIATGMPADGSDVHTPEELERPGVRRTSTQHLANPRAESPDAQRVVHEWLRRRARGDPQMVAAVRARTATPPPVRDEEDTDVLTVLTRQHDQVTALVKQLDAIPGRSKGGTPAQASERESIVDMIAKTLAAHETAEEEHLWPRVREVLPGDGDVRAAVGLEQEQQATETLAALAKGDPQTEEYDRLAETLMSQLHKHVAHEDRVFLALREALDEDERRRIGERVLAAQRTAPTRPQPATDG